MFNTHILDGEIAIYNEKWADTGCDGLYLKGEITYEATVPGWYNIMIDGKSLLTGDIVGVIKDIQTINNRRFIHVESM